MCFNSADLHYNGDRSMRFSGLIMLVGLIPLAATAQCHLVSLGRTTCINCGAGWYPARDPEGTPATGACWPVYKAYRRVTKPPDPEGTPANLPHTFRRIPVRWKLGGILQECLRHVGQNEVRWIGVEPAELVMVASNDATMAALPVTGNSARNRNTPPRPEPAKYWAKSAVASVRIAPGAIGLPAAS